MPSKSARSTCAGTSAYCPKSLRNSGSNTTLVSPWVTSTLALATYCAVDVTFAAAPAACAMATAASAAGAPSAVAVAMRRDWPATAEFQSAIMPISG